MKSAREWAGEFGLCGCEGPDDDHTAECDERTELVRAAQVDALRWANSELGNVYATIHRRRKTIAERIAELEKPAGPGDKARWCECNGTGWVERSPIPCVCDAARYQGAPRPVEAKVCESWCFEESWEPETRTVHYDPGCSHECRTAGKPVRPAKRTP